MKSSKEIIMAALPLLFLLVGAKAMCQDNSNYVLNFLPTSPVPISVQMDNELEPSNEGMDEDIQSNPLLLDGQSLNFNEFGLQSEGTLTLLVGDPLSQNALQIPFTIKLRRYGKILDDPSMDFMNKELYGVEISSVLQFALPGDHLIITPTQNKYWKAKRLLRVVARGC